MYEFQVVLGLLVPGIPGLKGSKTFFCSIVRGEVSATRNRSDFQGRGG